MGLDAGAVDGNCLMLHDKAVTSSGGLKVRGLGVGSGTERTWKTEREGALFYFTICFIKFHPPPPTVLTPPVAELASYKERNFEVEVGQL